HQALQVSALVDDRAFANVEDLAVVGTQGQLLHFLHHRQSPPQDRLVPGVHLEQNFRTHPNVLAWGKATATLYQSRTGTPRELGYTLREGSSELALSSGR